MTALSPTLGLTLALLLFAPAGSAEDLSPRGQAEALFEEYQRRAAAFDPKVADLYWDQARIVNVRKYPGDLPDRALNLVGFQYKAKIHELMPTAKARGDYSTYSDISYSTEGSRIRIRCTRFSLLKKYSSPYSMLVGPDENGSWRIFEELSESRP